VLLRYTEAQTKVQNETPKEIYRAAFQEAAMPSIAEYEVLTAALWRM
jgi:hypothetical protein